MCICVYVYTYIYIYVYYDMLHYIILYHIIYSLSLCVYIYIYIHIDSVEMLGGRLPLAEGGRAHVSDGKRSEHTRKMTQQPRNLLGPGC